MATKRVSKSTLGLVYGKFYPPHMGHKMMIQWASRQVDNLYVLVISKPGDKPNGRQRLEWLTEIHGNLYNTTFYLLETDQREDYIDRAVYREWNDLILEVIGCKEGDVDFLFGSEPTYNAISAELMGAKPVVIDAARHIVPISATKVRENPYTSWAYLDEVVRAYYAKRICVLGAESTGTTTITKILADIYETSWVPEYGRAYTIPKYRDNQNWTTEDFEHITTRQLELEDEAARMCNRLLFCDTDALTTQLFHRQYMGYDSEIVQVQVESNNSTRRYDLTFLTFPDIPWEDDGLRHSPEVRAKMHKWFVEETAKRPEPVVFLQGTVEERERVAIAAIEKHLGFRYIGTMFRSGYASLKPNVVGV